MANLEFENQSETFMKENSIKNKVKTQIQYWLYIY